MRSTVEDKNIPAQFLKEERFVAVSKYSFPALKE
jgi:hypothetical protein